MFSCDVLAQLPTPIARYEMNNSPSDISGNQNHGKIVGNVKGVEDRFGKSCSALFFDGKSGFIEVPSSSTLESVGSIFTITVWYKLPKVTTPVNWLTILCKGTQSVETPANPQYRLQVQQNRDLLLNPCSPYVPSAYSTISINTEFTECDDSLMLHLFEQDVWHFYAVTYDGGKVKTFMDGRKVFEKPYAGNINYNSDQLLIGKDIPGVTEYFHGTMDDLRIYGQALTENQLFQLYQTKPAPLSPEDNLDISYPLNIDVGSEKGKCYTKVNFPPPVINRSCYPYSISQIEGAASGSNFSVGESRITYKITSATGPSIFNTFYVRVNDQEDPVIKFTPDTTIYIPKGQQAVRFNFTTPIATDNCKIKIIEQLSGGKSGDYFDEGEHLISFRAQDFSGNMAFETFKVRVEKTPEEKIDTVIKINEIPQKDTIVNVIPVKEVDSLPVNKYKKLNIVLLVDISNSMSESEKLPKLKESVKGILVNLRPTDNISLVTFSSNPNTIKSLGPVGDKAILVDMIDNLKTSGATEFTPGIEEAFKTLKQNYTPNALNHIFLFTDGLFTMSKSQEKSFNQMALSKTMPVGLSIINVVDKYSLKALEEIAQKINASFIVVSNIDEAKQVSFEHLKILSEVK